MNKPQTIASAFLMSPEEAPRYWLVDSVWSVLASADTTGGALTVLEQLMPARSGPPPHVHERLHEYFYLLDGEIRFQLGAEARTAKAGDLLSVPVNTVHGFAVVSTTARVLNLYTPGGFSEQVSFLGAPASEFRLPRDGEQLPPTPDRQNAYLTRSAELNTQRWLGPDEAEDLLADERDVPSGH